MKCKYLITILIFLAACSNQKGAHDETTGKAPQNIVTLTGIEMQNAGIELSKPRKGSASSFLKVNGLVEAPPLNIVSVSFPMSGFLVSTNLLPGMKVTKGQALAVIQDQSLIQLQQDYLIAKTKVSFLQKEFERQKMLNATKTASDKILEQTESEYRMQRILVSSLAEKLRLVQIDPSSLGEHSIRRSVVIRSPITGYVSAVHSGIGKYVHPSDVLFELVNPKNLHLAVRVFEKDLPFISVGQKLQVTLVNNPAVSLDAAVSLVSKTLDNDRTGVVHCHFLNSTEQLLPGMFANASIEIQNHEGIIVPEEAVIRWNEADYIFIQKISQEFELVPVKAGAAANDSVDIASAALNLMDQTIVTKNAYAVLMKLQNKAE